ncbi:MAG: hypothetical protein GAK43_01502 [Stenotrophomonas maltophilia]|nr:MAG: hypothetical protein GAK43_01502 [Stenotrophomonas maltophilia]
MEQSGIVGFFVSDFAEKVSDFRLVPFCTQSVFAQMMGAQEITEDVVRGWVESRTLPSVKIGRRRLVNLHRIRHDLDEGKMVFGQGDYGDGA